MSAVAYKLHSVPENKTRHVAPLCNRAAVYGWPNYVVPTDCLLDAIQPHIERLQHEAHTPTAAKEQVRSRGDGWRSLLAHRTALILRSEPDTVYRKLNSITTHAAWVINTQYADAFLLALGLRLDHDIELPILPGNLATAKELITTRADSYGIELEPFALNRLARQTIRICRLVVYYPHHRDRLLDLAPLNCLRPEER